MAIPTTSRYTATLQVPQSGNPEQRVSLTTDADGRLAGLTASSSESPAAAQNRIIRWLEDALAAARA